MAFKKRRIFDMHEVQSQQRQRSSGSHKNSTVISNAWMLPKAHRKRLPRHRVVLRWFSENLRNYCQTTSLHGFSYMTRMDISRNERIFWTAIVVLAILTSITLVLLSLYWNQETPTVTVIESSHFPTWNVPFPAVTICNFNKLSKRRVTQLQSTIQMPPGASEVHLHQLFNLTLYPTNMQLSNQSLVVMDSILKLNNLTMNLLTERIRPDCLEMISRCLWKGMSTRCDGLFQRIVTMEGLCCSFNNFAASTNNFPPKIAYQVSRRPYRVTGCGYPTGLSVLLNPQTSDYFGTFFSGYGFRLLIHDAYNVPDENAETKVVTATRESFVRISPESTYATNDIRRMDLKLRNCLFWRERELEGLQRYSFVNCMHNCRVQMIIKRCGCVPGFVSSNSSFPSCDVLAANCAISSIGLFSFALADQNSSHSLVSQTDRFPCNCLPDCQSNHYASESTMGKLNMNYALNRVWSTAANSSNQTDNILLHVFYSDLMSTRYRMDIFQNWLSSLASFGGLLGLIMGFSIVTAFEFLYFLTFRPVFNYMNKD